MPLKRLGKPPFLRAEHVVDGDLVEILKDPYTKYNERFNRERGYAVVKLLRTGEVYTWPLNPTTWDRLLDAWGELEDHWIGKLAKLKLMDQLIHGENRKVIYGIPYHEPQQQLPATAPEAPSKPTIEEDIAQRIEKLSPEAKTALLETLKEETA